MSTVPASVLGDAYWRDPFTLEHLIYVLRVYEEIRARQATPERQQACQAGSVEAESRMEDYRDVMRLSGVLAEAPGKGRIQLLCEGMDSANGLTAANVVKLRVQACRAKPCSLEEANALTLNEAADVLERTAAAAPPPVATEQGEGGTPPAGRLKGIPLPEAEIKVREWLAANAKGNPAGITRDAVAAGAGVSGATVSRTAAWKAFRDRRDAEKKPGAREIPLTDGMEAAMASDCESPDELAALIGEQKKDEAEQERRHKRRSEPF